MNATVGRAIPKDRATAIAGKERSAPMQTAPKKRQRASRLASRRNNKTVAIKNAIHAKPMKLSVEPIHLGEPTGNAAAAMAPSNRFAAAKLNSGESAFGTKKCHNQYW